MHNYVARVKFTTKPRLREFFSNVCHLPVIFTREFFSTLLPGEFVHDKIFICILKARLGGEISLSDVIMHGGCYIEFFRRLFLVLSFPFVWESNVFCNVVYHNQLYSKLIKSQRLVLSNRNIGH